LNDEPARPVARIGMFETPKTIVARSARASRASARIGAAVLVLSLTSMPSLGAGDKRQYPGAPARDAESREVETGIVAGPVPAPYQEGAPATRPEVAVPQLGPAPAPESRVGVDESNPLPLSLTSAMEMALNRNRDIYVERINVLQAGYDVQAAEGVYDGQVHALSQFNSQTVPVASFLGGGQNGATHTETFAAEATFRKLLKTGGFFEAGATSLRTDTDNVFSALNPTHQTGLSFTLRQPLARNRSIDDNRRRLRIARKRLDLGDAQFRQRVIETIVGVQRGYWDLAYALRSVQVARESVELAETQMSRLRRLVDQGVSAPVELVQVEAELQRRRENVLSALEGVTRAENNLKALILEDASASEWDRPLVPTDQPGVVPINLAVGDAVSQAVGNRPELALLRSQKEINDIDERYYKNQRLPQVDFFASYGLTGLAGTESLAGNPFSGSSSLLTDRVNVISRRLGLDPLPTTTPTGVAHQLVGGVGQSLQSLFGNDYRSFRFGIEINWSVDNDTAEANYGRAKAEGRKLDAQRQALVQRVEREVRNALQGVQTARQRVETSRASREAAEVQLASEQRRADAGLSTTFFVLTRQNELADARARELRALTDYNAAVVELQRVIGTTLSANAIDVDAAGEGATANE
jgi:HAE1 family hydrophobic/amphiphilic exporter-1